MQNRILRTTLAGIACAGLAGTAAAAAATQQATPPSQTFLPAPSMAQAGAPNAAPDATPPASEQWVDQQVAQYRKEVESRVARGDLNPDEAERLIGWRRWQIQQQAAGRAPAPAIVARQGAVDQAQRQAQAAAATAPPYYATYPAPYYPAAPYYRSPYYASPYYPAPYYYGPRYAPYVPGISVCTGGFGRRYSASFCF
ncbi:MAG: hypothetical protein ABI294_00910 [Casimicrobiaceae bacterium]